MWILTTPIPAGKQISSLRKFKVMKARDIDVDEDDLPGAVDVFQIPIKLIGESGNRWPINPTLQIRNGVESQILIENPSPTSLEDQFQISTVLLSGTPYTTLVNAYYAVSGKLAMRRALEPLLVSMGAVPANFAGGSGT